MLERAGAVVVEEAASDVIALEQSVGRDEPWAEPGFIDKIIALQRRRETAAPATGDVFFDRSPVCTLALSRYLNIPVSCALAEELDRIRRGRIYERTVFFLRNQGFVHPTAARRIRFEDSLDFERIHEHTYRELGYERVDVPAGPLIERAARVQRTVDAMGAPCPHTW
jgi:predicted ATPase